MPNEQIEYVDFIRGCKNPRLGWIMAQLVILGVTHRIEGMSFNGPVLQVQKGQLELAWEVLNIPVGVMNVAGALTDDTIKVMDLVDDHPLFVSKVDIEDFPAQVHTAIDTVVETVAEAPAVEPLTEVELDQLDVETEVTPEAEPMVKRIDKPETDNSIDDWLNEPVTEEADVVTPDTTEYVDADSPEPEDPFAEDDDELWATDEEPVDEHPELDYLKADKALPNTEVQYDKVEGTVKMYEVSSGNLSRIGAKVKQSDQTKCTFYAEFAGGVQPYRYGPVDLVRYQELLGEAVRKSEGRQEASVGSLFHHLVKVDAEAGAVACQRLVEGRWVIVPPKAARVKAVKAKVSKK